MDWFRSTNNNNNQSNKKSDNSKKNTSNQSNKKSDNSKKITSKDMDYTDLFNTPKSTSSKKKSDDDDDDDDDDVPYTARELYLMWLTEDTVVLKDGRILSTILSLNKPALEMAALIDGLNVADGTRGDNLFNLDTVTVNYNFDLDDDEIKQIISPLVIRCSEDDTDWDNVKMRFPCIAEKIDTNKNLNMPNIAAFNPNLTVTKRVIMSNPNLSLSQQCDFMMMNKSISNIELLSKTLQCVVKKKWVKFAAVFTINDQLRCVRAQPLTSYNDNGVIYISDNNVYRFLYFLNILSPAKTIIWQFEPGGICINMTKLFRVLFDEITKSPIQFFCVSCSIGLPLHKIFTSWQFLHQWVNENWSSVNTSEELVLLSLRRRLKPLLKKLGTDVHWSKCIELYRKEYQTFMTTLVKEGDLVDIDNYFFQHIYSYPEPDEWTTLIGRLINIQELNDIPTPNSNKGEDNDDDN